jgi:hypothetical protein
MANTYVIVNGELYHHGTKGMKWGRRRYQNPDGSLTPAGRMRYGSGESSFDRWKKERAAKKEAKKEEKVEAKSSDRGYTQRRVKGMTDDGVNKAISRSQLEERYNQQVRSKNAKEGSYRGKALKDMNDDELAKAIERTKMEQEYKRLNPEKVSFGKTVATKFLNEALVPAAIGAGKNFLEKTFNKFVDKAVGVEVDELAKLKREFDIEDYKKKIHDLKNPKEDINETITRLQNEQKLKDLNDEEYQNLKKEAEKSKWRRTIRDGVDPEDPVTKGDATNVNNSTKNKTAVPDSENDASPAPTRLLALPPPRDIVGTVNAASDKSPTDNPATTAKGKSLISKLFGKGPSPATLKSQYNNGKTVADLAKEFDLSETKIRELLQD